MFLRQAGQQQKKVVLHKGALLVSAYIKEQDCFAADGPQDIAASILRGFDQAKQRHHEEQVSTRRMVARLVPKVASPHCVSHAYLIGAASEPAQLTPSPRAVRW